jgi:glycosyltransferase involved in cell wall biosynthesis
LNFALYYAGDAYSTANKIMGRQSAGKAFMKGVARTWPQGVVRGVGQNESAARELLAQLRGDGFLGKVQWSHLPQFQSAIEAGALYYPAPPAKDLAAARNLTNPGAFSLMGVTHTLSSAGAADQVADCMLPPFKPWDALICTSIASRDFVQKLHEEVRESWRQGVGATRFNDIQLPVIPLGVDVPSFLQPGDDRPGDDRANAREIAQKALGLAPGSGPGNTVFLFAGRLSFHAKANPAALYQALQSIASKTGPITCIEAGVFPNTAVQAGFQAAQAALAPDVAFVWVDGNDAARYRCAWQAADVFVSLSDNIQETFGLTPVEAMAAGLPVIVADWDGYKDTVRDGIDGYRIPTVMPPAGIGSDLALRHALGLDTYDYFIGRTSMATVVEPRALASACLRLASDPALRLQMGAAGRRRAQEEYDWPVILHRYDALAAQLNEIRRAHSGPGLTVPAQPWPQRADPFHRFAHFPSATLPGHWRVALQGDAQARLPRLLSLSMLNYAFSADSLDAALVEKLLSSIGGTSGGVIEDFTGTQSELTVQAALVAAGCATPSGVRALMWMWKFGLVEISAVT